MLDPIQSRARQKRLLAQMQQRQLDAIVVALPWHVYYLSAHLTHMLHQSGMIIFSDGRSWLATANEPATNVAADEVGAFEAQWMATLRQEQPELVADMIIEQLKTRGARRVGIDCSQVTAVVAAKLTSDVTPIDPMLWQLRRVKDRDELELMKTAIRASEAMYARARQIVEPGIPELLVFTELEKAGVEAIGEPMTAPLGNDFVCGQGGGPPRRDRTAQAGEIYILDLGPSFRGYFADNCRAFSVDRKPTDAQLKAAKAVTDALAIVEKLAKPGARCRDLFRAVDEHLKASMARPLVHHLGHGVGLQPHEFPHLNPKWDDVLMEGEIFAAEPGVYGQDLNWGIRIENNYLVTKSGVQNLLNAPMEMV
jgi:Xaa-Pro dipeptidase